tara:strand:- start:1558 stop:2061 length:504 start_codon:yes stop_codon:yes gene_type:complete
VKEKVKRNFLEINTLKQLNESKKLSSDYSLNLVDPVDFQLNKFFYKNIGRNHEWVDRLSWSDKDWTNYVSLKNINTYILKYKNDLVGFFELIFHKENNETEIAYFGILKEYQNKKLGSYLLSEAIKISFNKGTSRVWAHTCSLDHKNALNNYLSRGMKIFKSEILMR